MREIWQRLDNEEDRHYQMFQKFLEGKTLKEIAKEADMAYHTVSHISRKYRWEDRRSAYRAYMQQIAEEEKIKKIEEVCMRHAKQAEQLQLLLMLPAKALAEKLRENPEEIFAQFKNIDPVELLGMLSKLAPIFKPLVQTERLALGLSTDNVAEQHDIVNIDITPADPSFLGKEEKEQIEHQHQSDKDIL